jgi:hypothetical protein
MVAIKETFNQSGFAKSGLSAMITQQIALLIFVLIQWCQKSHIQSRAICCIRGVFPSPGRGWGRSRSMVFAARSGAFAQRAALAGRHSPSEGPLSIRAKISQADTAFSGEGVPRSGVINTDMRPMDCLCYKRLALVSIAIYSPILLMARSCRPRAGLLSGLAAGAVGRPFRETNLVAVVLLDQIKVRFVVADRQVGFTVR